jgi:hypothetical protein
MAVRTSAGTTLNTLAALPATYDSTGFNALSWGTGNLVGEVTDMGEIGGREYNVITHLPMGSRRASKLKGSYNSGQMQIQLGRDAVDAGQILLRAALVSDNDYSFRVVLQDNTKVYFTGKVTALKTNIGNADQVTGLTVTVEINSDIVEA